MGYYNIFNGASSGVMSDQFLGAYGPLGLGVAEPLAGDYKPLGASFDGPLKFGVDGPFAEDYKPSGGGDYNGFSLRGVFFICFFFVAIIHYINKQVNQRHRI